MDFLTSKDFWLKALARALRTFCQSILSLITVGNSIIGFDWISILEISATAALISILTSVSIGFPEGEKYENN